MCKENVIGKEEELLEPDGSPATLSPQLHGHSQQLLGALQGEVLARRATAGCLWLGLAPLPVPEEQQGSSDA